MTERPSFRRGVRNWFASDRPFVERCRLTLRNNAIKLRTRQPCCGNHGEPGC